jgi:hypothetical protein
LNNKGISHFDVLFIDGLQCFLPVVEEDVEEQVGEDADKPNQVDGAGDPLEHLDLHAPRMRSPVHLQQSVHRRHAVVDNPREEDGEGVEGEADLAAGHDLVDAVVEQSDHVDERHEEGASADDDGSVVDEIEELEVVGVVADRLVVHVLGDVGDDQHAEVVHLRGDAKRID